MSGLVADVQKAGVSAHQIDAVIADPKQQIAPLPVTAARAELYEFVTAEPGRYLLSADPPGPDRGQIGLLTVG